jgi:hypothetical protein
MTECVELLNGRIQEGQEFILSLINRAEDRFAS